MPVMSVAKNKRSLNRKKAVLPVRVRGNDLSGNCFDELAHTLDVTPAGARLGGLRRELKALEHLTILYRQRKIEFRIIWTKKLEKAGEYQVGLEAMAHEHEAWGLNPSDFPVRNASQPPAAVSEAGVA